MSDKTTRAVRGIVRQGDVLLVPVEEIPRRRRQEEAGRGLVLAEGEATGHAHTVQGRARIVRATRHHTVPADRYLIVEGGAARIVHEEHEPITVARGAYRVVRQREYRPAPRWRGPQWRWVAD
jgi:hypothetical protein